MGRPKKQREPDDDGQPLLIDVDSPTAKAIRPLALRHNRLKSNKKKIDDDLKDVHEKMLNLIEEDQTIKCDPEGVKRFQFDGIIIEVKPSGQSISVKKAKGSKSNDDD